MNAAFLLVTGAMLVGQGGEKIAPPASAVHPAPAASSCCNTTDPCGCEGWGHRLRGKLGGLFHRDNCDSCKPTTCNDHHRPTCNTGCDKGCRTKLWQPHCREPKTCAPTCTDSCGHGSFNLLSNLRHRFGKNECCDGGCASNGNGTAAPVYVTPPAKAGEKIDLPPKKLPVEPKKVVDPPKKIDAPKKVTEEVRIEPQPIAPNVVAPLPAPPTVDITPVPVPVPRVEGDRRDPF